MIQNESLSYMYQYTIDYLGIGLCFLSNSIDIYSLRIQRLAFIITDICWQAWEFYIFELNTCFSFHIPHKTYFYCDILSFVLCVVNYKFRSIKIYRSPCDPAQIWLPTRAGSAAIL